MAGLTVFAALFLLSSIGRFIISFSFLPFFSKTAFDRTMQSNQFLLEVLAGRPARDLSSNLVSSSVSGYHQAKSGVDFSRRMAQQGIERTVRMLRPMRKISQRK